MKLVLLVALLLSSFVLFGMQLRTNYSNGQSSQSDQALASEFAPVLHFTSGEKFYPTSVGYIIGSSELMLRGNNGSASLVDPNPTPSDLGANPSPNLFLNNKLGTLDAIASDYASKAASSGYYAYVHVTNQVSGTVIQYWLFYAYNNGVLNDHQGDIEVIEVFLGPSGNPQQLLLSQHLNGESTSWSDVELSGDTHPVVYVAQGSHANYFRSYQGKIGIESDIVSNDGKTITPDQLTLVMLGEQKNHPADQSWLDFQGRWGYWGTDSQVALGMAGPYGPVFNEQGIRWSDPNSYLSQTFSVNSYYFLLAWIAANLLLLFGIYYVARASWKIFGIFRLSRKGGLLVGKFLRGRGSIGLILGMVGILITLAALFLPWYSVSASSQNGPLSGQGNVNLLTIDGIHGMSLNMFLGTTGEATSGYRSFLSTEVPFAIFIGVGLALIALDVIGVKSGKKLGSKFIGGAITSLLPFILIFVFIAALPNFIPFASALVPGQTVPQGVVTMINTIASHPISGSTSQVFDVVGTTTVNWGFGLGAYLFLAAAVIRIIGGFVIRTSPELKQAEKLPVGPAPSRAPSS